MRKLFYFKLFTVVLCRFTWQKAEVDGPLKTYGNIPTSLESVVYGTWKVAIDKNECQNLVNCTKKHG